MTFRDPAWLLLALVAVPFAWIALRWFVSMSRWRRWSAVATRTLLLTLLAALLAGASVVRESNRLAVVGVVDVSGSVERFAGFGTDEFGQRRDVRDAARAFLREAAGDRGREDLLGLVVFDGRATAIATPLRAGVLDRSMEIERREGTDIARAIRYAAGLIPPDAAGRIVLFSDGNETTGDALASAREVAQRTRSLGEDGGGVPIDVVPVRYRIENEVVVESVDVPPRAAADSTLTARVLLRSTGEARGTLRLFREGEPVDLEPGRPGTGREVRLRRGLNVEIAEVDLGPGRVHRFEAVFEPEGIEGAGRGERAFVGDTILENNRAQAFTVTPGKGSVLLVDGVSAGVPDGAGRTLARALEESGIEVDVVSPDGMPSDLLALQAYDLVILQNVSADGIDYRLHEQLAAYVRDLGGGLLKIGGPDAFGAGGWRGTALEPILPVRLELPERLVVPEAAIMFVIDNSGSMAASVMGSSRSQQEIANEAAALAVQSLDPNDMIGVIEFNHASRVVVPLGPNDDPERTASRVRSISPGGGTDLGPALAEARRQLQGVDARLKHVVVLSDGVSRAAETLPGIAAEMREEGIKVSAIAVGDMADTETMRLIAEEGDGAFYDVVSPTMLPRIFLRVVRVVRTPMVREAPFDVVMPGTGSALTAGLDQPPRLDGLVLTQVRDEPTITNAMLSPQGEPVLAHWPVELGQVAAFTSDAHRWARRWLDWPGYQQFWAQTVRSIARAGTDRGGELTSDLVGDELRLRFEAVDDDGRPRDLLTVPATVYGPAGDPVEIRLSQTGPGVYEGSVAARESGSYIAVVRPREGRQRLAPVLGGAAVSSGAEYRRLESDESLLRRISEITGGRVLELGSPELANLYDRSGLPPHRASVPLWPVLLAWTLFVFLLDVGTRRVAWDRFFSPEFGAARRAELDRVRERSARAASVVSGLKARRSQGEARRAASGAGSAALSEADARAVIMEQRRKREAAFQARIRAERERQEKEASGSSSPAAIEDRRRKDEASDGSGGLLAAKRRARERYGSEGDDDKER